MLFILEILLLFIKLFVAILIQLFLWDNLILKLVLLIICYALLYSLVKRKFNPIKDYFPDHYKMIYARHHAYNIFILFSYSSFFILGLLFLRFKNSERSIDIISYIKTIQFLISNSYSYSIILNILLIGFLLGLYWIIIVSVGRYYKYHLIKRHIYLSQGKSINFYDHLRDYIPKVYLDILWYKVYIIIDIILRCCNFRMLGIILWNKNRLHLFKRYLSADRGFTYLELYLKLFLKDIKYGIHHFICIILLLYDILYNNMVITHVFHILPYVFIYEIWVRFTKFYSYLHPNNDNLLYSLLYDPATIDREAGIIYTSSGELAMEDFQDIVFNYLFKGLVSQDQQELDQPHFIRKLRRDLFKKCIMIMRNILIKIHLTQQKFIGFTKIDYIILAEIILLIILLK